MKEKSTKLAVEIRDLQFVFAADICGRGTQPLCLVANETINKHIFTNLFQDISNEDLFVEKIFAIN